MRRALVVVFTMVLLFPYTCALPAKASLASGGSVQLTYEGLATQSPDYDQNFFFKGQQAVFDFYVSGVSNVTFYLVPFMGTTGYVPVYRAPSPGYVNFTVNTSALSVGLYQIVARAGTQEWDGVSSAPTKDYQENPWLLAVIEGFNATEEFSKLPPLTVPYGLGVNVHFSSPDSQDLVYLRMMSYAGIKIVRTDLFLVPGSQQPWNQQLSPWYDLATAEKAVGIRPLFILDGNPLQIISPNTSTWDSAYASYAGNASLTFSQFNPIFEIWNEPNDGGAGYGFWGLYPEQAYSNAASAAIIRMEAATGGKATVIAPASIYVGGTANTFIVRFGKQLNPTAFEHLAAFSVHPYRFPPPETASPDYISLKQDLQSENRSKPIVESEWGYETYAVGMLKQAEYYPRIYLTNLMNGVPITILFDWPDGPSFSWGLILDDDVLAGRGGPLLGSQAYMVKPSYFSLYYLDYSLNGYQFNQAYVNDRLFSEYQNGSFSYMDPSLAGQAGIYLLKFVRGRSVRYVLWSTNGTSNVTLTPNLLGSFSSVSVTNLFGYSHNATVSGGRAVVTTSGVPEILTVTASSSTQTTPLLGKLVPAAAVAAAAAVVVATIFALGRRTDRHSRGPQAPLQGPGSPRAAASSAGRPRPTSSDSRQAGSPGWVPLGV